MFEYDNFCNFILKYKLWLKMVTYIFISSFNLVTAHNFAVKIGGSIFHHLRHEIYDNLEVPDPCNQLRTHRYTKISTSRRLIT